MKFKATVSLALTIVLLIVGYISLESTAPTKLLLVPGVWAEFVLAPVVSPSTIGIGGPLGLLVVLTVSGAAWFTAIFVSMIVSGRLLCHSRTKKRGKGVND